MRRMASASEMPVEIHPLMEDAHSFNTAFNESAEHEMRPAGIVAIARPDVVTRSAELGIIRQDLEHPPNLANIELGLLTPPVLRGVVPYLVKVALRPRA